MRIEKVLRRFLEMARIFKSVEFQERYEAQARRNLEEEVKLLRGENY